jgi:erythronate-4-phosphate dehydrogenase
VRPGAWVLNSSRGPVVDGAALESAIRSGRVAAAALDVWENEPLPPASLVECVDIATPHIAGYGYDAKIAGAWMMEEALRAWLATEGRALPPAFDWSAAAPSDALTLYSPPASTPTAWLDAVVRSAYDIRADDARFREVMLDQALEAAERSAAFTDLRRLYPVRRSWRYFELHGDVPAELRGAVANGLGMRIGPI